MNEWAVWRHPQPAAAVGRCIGHTDLPVDRRKAKRLAHRVRQWARANGAARIVVTSPLRRASDVGKWLAAWGWRHRIDPRLCELDFGAWDGRFWQDIGADAVDAWCADFAQLRPGGGEAVASLLARCDEVLRGTPQCLVTHAGWISAARWLGGNTGTPSAADWPAAVPYANLSLIKACRDSAASASSRAA